MLIRPTGAHPLVYLGQLELPQPANLVRRQAFAFAPAVDGIFGDTQVFGNVEGGDPGLSGHGFGTKIKD